MTPFALAPVQVAAVGEGKILTDGSRKTRDILENISRFVSKEQNTTAVVIPLPAGRRVGVPLLAFDVLCSQYVSLHPDRWEGRERRSRSR